MRVLIAGGAGFLGTAITKSLVNDNHEVLVLTRHTPRRPNQFQWDGITSNGWGNQVNEVDAVLNLTGFGLEHWPWTKRQKQKFIDSRVIPGRALVSAIQNASRPPKVFLQISGINHYGLRGQSVADESTPAAKDFLAQLTVQWEAATQPVEDLGVRRIVVRTAVVLAKKGGLFPLMALPVRLFFGGKFGSGEQATPWIHLADQIGALRFLLGSRDAHGPYNLISPELTSNAAFMRTVSKVLRRPYWFHLPAFLLRIPLGEMSVLLTEGRFAQPKRLIELGFQFRFGSLEHAMEDLLIRKLPGKSGI